jgi:hypothetical protein
MDGKTLKGSLDAMAESYAAQGLSALTHAPRSILGQLSLPAKSNALPAGQPLIEEWGRRGRVFTLEAEPCQ